MRTILLIFFPLMLIFTGCNLNSYPFLDAALEIPGENGSISVYFCPRDGCEQKLYDFLDSADTSIHCALFELELESIKEKLYSKSKDIDVKLVVDRNYRDEVKNLDFVRFDDNNQLTHNKFCIVDSKKIFTGSFNPTQRGANTNNNNMLIIESDILSSNYEDEFSELWNGVFGDGRRVDNPRVVFNGFRVENYFCPEDSCMERTVDEIRRSNESIYFMTFSFTHPKIGTMLALKSDSGIDVKGIYEKRNWKTSTYSFLKYQGIDVKLDNNSNSMHHKVFIIDNRTVITGSFNPTKAGDYRNDENLLIIEDESIAKLYLEEFEYIYCNVSN